VERTELMQWLEALRRWRHEAQVVEDIGQRIQALHACETNERYVLWRLRTSFEV
jgi:hypothetical protein